MTILSFENEECHTFYPFTELWDKSISLTAVVNNDSIIVFQACNSYMIHHGSGRDAF